MTEEVSEAQVCPRDGRLLVWIGDDKRFLECSGFCGFRCDTFLSKEITELDTEPSPVTWNQVADALSLTIKKDDPSKLITFCAFILAKTEGDQINLGFQAESASEKTYIPLEVASYFPQEDIIPIAGASPTAFFHEYGAWDEERKVMIIDLRGKALVFLDFPDYRLIEKLRTLLSKDRPILTFKITDKSERHGLRTKTVELKGPTPVIFCSTKLNPDEQEKTRLLLLSPEVDQAKLEQALKLIALKESDPAAYEKTVGSDPRRRFLEAITQKVWASGVRNLIPLVCGMVMSWDDFDRLGREHHRLARSAERHLKDGYRKLEQASTEQEREEARKTIEAWSLTFSRHSREILKLLQMKYQAAKDLYGNEGWQIIHHPEEAEEVRKTRAEARRWLRMLERP